MLKVYKGKVLGIKRRKNEGTKNQWWTFEKVLLKWFQPEVWAHYEEAETDLELESVAYEDENKKTKAGRSEIDA